MTQQKNDMPSLPIIDLTRPRGRKAFATLLSSLKQDPAEVFQTVDAVLAGVRDSGDAALFAFTEKFDGRKLSRRTIRVSRATLEKRARCAPRALQQTLRQAARRITAFHRRQQPCSFTMQTSEGRLSQRLQPLRRVGVYVPGGYTQYPSSVLMNVIPAQLAGVPEIVVVTPPKHEIDPLVAYALLFLGITEVYRIGGAQAVAALAYGTKTIQSVDKIVGPGNQYVAAAKQRVFGRVDIDTVAGPSEVVLVVDSSVSPRWVALDLLAQAEHGSGNEYALCITEDRELARTIRQTLLDEISKSPVASLFRGLSPLHLAVCLTADRDHSIRIVNTVAPEHLQIMTRTFRRDVGKITNAAAIFLGPSTPAALGDYFAGTNHVLPTATAARYASPLGVESFIKRQSIAEITPAGLRKAAPHVSRFARWENLVHHAMSVEERVKEKRSRR